MRIAHKEDWEEINAYCEKYKVKTPPEGSTIFIDHDATGNICGLIAAQPRLIVEPMMAENSFTANKLFNALLGASSLLTKELWIQPKTEKLVNEALKLGFHIDDANVTTMRKLL